MPDAYICGHLRRTKITRTKITHKVSDVAEYIVLFGFFHPRSSCTTTHISADVHRITLNASCMTISGERTEQLYIFCCVTGFTSDFLSFIDVELIRFFHGAIQLVAKWSWWNAIYTKWRLPAELISTLKKWCWCNRPLICNSIRSFGHAIPKYS